MWRFLFTLALIGVVVAGCSVDTSRQRSEAGDTDVTANVQKVLENMQGVDPARIDVRTQDGDVTLTGNVDDARTRDDIGEVVAMVKGVDSVTNDLQVQQAQPAGTGAGTEVEEQPAPAEEQQQQQQPRPQTQPQQQQRTQSSEDVRSALKNSNSLSGMNINVRTQNGTVVLSGTVPNQSAKELAERIAREQEGVTKVQNNIQVKQQKQQQ